MINNFDWNQVLGPSGDEPVGGGGGIHRVWFEEEEKQVIFLVRLFRVAPVHLIKNGGDGFYARCQGDGCLLCGLKNKARPRLFMPCYDPEIGAVGVAQATTRMYPRALAPQLRRVLNRANGPVWVAVSTRDRIRFKVRSQPIQPGDDNGEEVIKEFTKKVESEEIDILSVCPRFTEDDLEIYGLVKR